MGLIRLALSFVLGPPLFLVAALCAGAAAAAQQGRASLRWDILTHFAPIWFAGALACALIALIALRGLSRLMILAMGAAGVIFAGMLIAPEFTRSTGPHAGPDAPGQLKIVQFNVWAHSEDPRASVDWLAREDPDIVVLEETTPEFRRLVAAEGRWRIVCPQCEVMILSKRPAVAYAPRSAGRAPGPIARATFRDAAGEFTVIGVHNAWPTDAGDQQAQEARLARAIAGFPRERTIVTGDFNSAPWSFYRQRWDANFDLPRRDRALFSWPARQSTRMRWLGAVPILPIDHVFAGPGWATVSITRGPKLSSDHYPVVAILAPVAPR
jgi:endonuclease/exonuclease/phosphatase (EEP) superfamily protein YafD